MRLLRDDRSVEAAANTARAVESDAELLRRFVTDRSDLAFAELVTRYGPLVMSVCRRVLTREQDAEDAFQAAFLVLARKAASLRHARSLPAWLHKTAYRIALRARMSNVRRREQPLDNECVIAEKMLPQITSDHDQSSLDEELSRLPDKYRLPLFLCCVEGLSRDEAARKLGWSPGALKGRLERGRQLLRRRLMLRRASLGVALGLVISSQQTAQGAVTPALAASTVQAGMQYAAGQAVVGYVTENALSLANGSLQAMSMTASKIVLGSLFVIGLLTWGTSWLPIPAIAGDAGIEGQVPALQASAVASSEPESLIAFVADREGDKPRRSPEAEAGPRRSPEAEAGPRRSPEAEVGPRRSPEAEARSRRSSEREAQQGLEGFRPQTDREARLYRMIQQLQREVGELRRELRAQAPARDREITGDSDVHGRGDSRDRPVATSTDPAVKKVTKIYQAYDKDRNDEVTFEEFLAMREGADDPRVQAQARLSFKQVDRNGDGRVSFEEFFAAAQRRGRGEPPRREGDAPRDGERSESVRDQPRDGNHPRPEGDRPRDRGPREQE